ncbi:MAG: hypothetical protein KIT60_12225 [Burkholderiaceae bacterium]|nr:hypothetical protein [Burkholderiaceae bacterium]
MTALQQFNRNVDASDKLVHMYRQLRGFRNLGARGRLDAQNQDLLWLPRSAVVAAISALDTYVHSVVKERLPRQFGAGIVVPESLAEQLSQLMPVRNANTFRQAVPLLLANDTLPQLLKKLEENFLQFQSYQAPEKIIEAYRLIGIENVFEPVSDLWPGPNTTAEHLRRRLAGYVQRRNQIAHEGDLEANGQQRPMQPEYAVECRDFVGSLVTRLNQVVYAA